MLLIQTSYCDYYNLSRKHNVLTIPFDYPLCYIMFVNEPPYLSVSIPVLTLLLSNNRNMLDFLIYTFPRLL